MTRGGRRLRSLVPFALGAVLLIAACEMPSGQQDQSGAITYAWEMLPGDAGDMSLNYGSGSGFYPQLAVFNGLLYATWYEQIDSVTRIRVAVHEPDGWRFIDGGASDGLNRDHDANAFWSRLLVHDGRLVCYWHEEIAPDVTTIRVAVLSGERLAPAWDYLDGGVETGLRTSSESSADYASLASYEGRLYAAWRSLEGAAYQIRSRVFSGDYASPAWDVVDPGTFGINADPSRDAYYPKLHAHEGKLYAAWYEREDLARQLRVAVYNGNDAAPAWSMVDGGAGGLNYNPAHGARGPQLLTHSETLYAVWHEREAPGRRQVRVARMAPDTPDPAWEFIDGSDPGGLNRAEGTDGWWARATSFGSWLLVAWAENDSGPYRIRLEAFNNDSDTWSRVDPEGGLNVDPEANAEYPHLVADGTVLYLGWSERANGVSRVFVRQAVPVNGEDQRPD
jgi:hypothetical protein